MPTKITTRFRELLKRPELLVMPGGFSPLHARMAEVLRYDAFFMSGSQVAAYIYGLPDVGLIGCREMVEAGRRTASGCAIPIFADADTGYGNAVNVYHTVRQFIGAGVAGVHIEDQEAPKKSGTQAGRRCVSAEEAIGKYKAAGAARNELDPDFVICARCDLIGAEGGNFEGAIERCVAYVQEAGVDAIWVNTLRSREEIQEACRRIPAPVIAPYYGPPPSPTFEEFQKLGAAAVLYPSLTTANGLQATWDLMHEFKERGPVVLEEWNKRAKASRWGVVPRTGAPLLDTEKIRKLEASFIPGSLQRDYAGTFGHNRH
ncbi:MAG TPA: isocitrate lyase/PEP mutase family protein [Candidatus Binatia bacterium]|jgi:2-methylisocitrate lyase-like PEP mutase family enzyme|nr:isocitrate lyase/PEP mutase family protein [Candidatus Binatia bacterium]